MCQYEKPFRQWQGRKKNLAGLKIFDEIRKLEYPDLLKSIY
jgi:hypothetical protein